MNINPLPPYAVIRRHILPQADLRLTDELQHVWFYKTVDTRGSATQLLYDKKKNK